MNKYIKYIIATVIFTGCVGAKAQMPQLVAPERIYYASAPPKTRLINWLPEDTVSQRYTIALRPVYLSQNGLKIDFEYELAKPGKWLQFELIGHYAPEYNYNKEYYEDYGGYYNYYYHSGWSHSFLSGGERYHSLKGIGGGIAYKSISSNSGWYTSVGLTFNYFDVGYYGAVYTKYMEDGIEKIVREEKLTGKKFYKPEIYFNIGKHMAITRSIFLDAYIGLGLTYSFYDGDNKFTYSNYAFGGRGLIFNAGFRIGWLIGK